MIISKSDKKLQDIKNRGALMEGNYLQTASDIINNVIKNGDTALFEYTKKFDKFDINKDNIKVSRQEIEEAYKNTDEKLIEAIKKAKENILSFHKMQMEKTWLYTRWQGCLFFFCFNERSSCCCSWSERYIYGKPCNRWSNKQCCFSCC